VRSESGRSRLRPHSDSLTGPHDTPGRRAADWRQSVSAGCRGMGRFLVRPACGTSRARGRRRGGPIRAPRPATRPCEVRGART